MLFEDFLKATILDFKRIFLVQFLVGTYILKIKGICRKSKNIFNYYFFLIYIICIQKYLTKLKYGKLL